ncbi:MAG TPA: hypothetical protein VM076_22710 [Gemmatimonadaceae bacterium]|nr:hypothetical protein [Gemmatimonadaceae bacterium]
MRPGADEAERSEIRRVVSRRYATPRWISGTIALLAITILTLIRVGVDLPIPAALRASLAVAMLIGVAVFVVASLRQGRERAWAEFAMSDAGTAELASAFLTKYLSSGDGSPDVSESSFIDYLRRDNRSIHRELIKPGPFSTWLIIGRALARGGDVPLATAAPIAKLILARLVERHAIVVVNSPSVERRYSYANAVRPPK